jgi:hypothetical protein
MAAEKKLRRDVRLRLKQAIERERKWNDAYEKAQERVRRSRTEATLNRYLDQAVKAEKYRRKAAKEIAELRPHVARLAEAGRIASRIATTYRARQNATTPVSATVAKKEKRLQEERRRRLLQANVDADPRTAMGNREMDVVGLGASLRASINHFNSCFRRRDDRSNSRIMAWSKFDELQDMVHRGDLKSPGLEPSIDNTRTPDIANAKLEAKRQDAALKAYLGILMHGMMVDVIFWQRRYTDLVPLHGDVEGIGYMFRRALDMTAAWFGITPDDERGRVARRAIERRFQEAGASSQ